MASATMGWQDFLGRLRLRQTAGPVLIVMVLAMMVLPLPPFVLDLLFTFNIAMALMVLMVAAYMIRPLDFAAFPTVLLFATLFRLAKVLGMSPSALSHAVYRLGIVSEAIERYADVMSRLVWQPHGAERDQAVPLARLEPRRVADRAARPGHRPAGARRRNLDLLLAGRLRLRVLRLGRAAHADGRATLAGQVTRGEGSVGAQLHLLDAALHAATHPVDLGRRVTALTELLVRDEVQGAPTTSINEPIGSRRTARSRTSSPSTTSPSRA